MIFKLTKTNQNRLKQTVWKHTSGSGGVGVVGGGVVVCGLLTIYEIMSNETFNELLLRGSGTIINILFEKIHFIALIHPIQWTIANSVGADRPAKRQKKTSCVSTGWPVPVLCIRQVAHGIYFLSRQHDVIASFSFGACTVQTRFSTSPDTLSKSVHYGGFSTSFVDSFSVEVLSTDQARIYL